MRLCEEFAETVMETKDSFIINDGERNHFFAQIQVNNVRLIYHGYSFGMPIPRVENSLDLVAIVTRDQIIFFKPLAINIWNDSDYPEGTISMKKICEEFNRKIATDIFPKFLDSLPAGELRSQSSCEQMARSAVLQHTNPEKYAVPCHTSISDNQLLQILCGCETLENTVTAKLEEKKDFYGAQKATLEEVMRQMKRHDLVTELEQTLADSIYDLDAKSITVEFEVNQVVVSAKMSPSRLMSIIVDRDEIDYWDFLVDIRGKELFNALNVKSLSIGDISRITFGKKVLYTK